MDTNVVDTNTSVAPALAAASTPQVLTPSRRSAPIVLWTAILAVILVAIVGLTGGWFLAAGLAPRDPYVQTVLSLAGNGDRGQGIFAMNCATCHGPTGAGNVGPSLVDVSTRKSRAALIQQVVSGQTPPMPQFQPEAQDMADLLRYLENL